MGDFFKPAEHGAMVAKAFNDQRRENFNAKVDGLLARLDAGYTRPIATPNEFAEAAEAIRFLMLENKQLKDELRKEAWLCKSK